MRNEVLFVWDVTSSDSQKAVCIHFSKVSKCEYVVTAPEEWWSVEAVPELKSSTDNLEGCLKLLSGEKDEQRLAGLLLATKFIRGDDTDSIIKIYQALGICFLERLLKTGTTKSAGTSDQQEAYLQLATTIFSAFCRVPELASLNETISKVPILLKILKNWSEAPVSVDCLEGLLGVAVASEKGFLSLHESGALPILANHVCQSLSDNPSLELAVKLMCLLLVKIPSSVNVSEYAEDLASSVIALSRAFAINQTAFKFDVLLFISTLVSSDFSAPIRNALCSKSTDGFWKTCVRVGVGTILQNRVDADKKSLALLLAESMMEMLGEDWLLGSMNLPGDNENVESDRCFILVLQASRVEIAVLLNDLARLKFDSSSIVGSSLKEDSIKRNLANIYALIENIIKLLAKSSQSQDSAISESTMLNAMSALNESIDVVFDFLEDAKNNNANKGDDLLASVRIIGRYLAEAPSTFQDKFPKLLGYLLTITGEGEERPFLSVQFLLPTLCQITMDSKGSNALISCEGHKQVIEYLLRLCENASEDSMDSVLLAFDTILNILSKKNDIRVKLKVEDFIHLLPVLVSLAAKSGSSMVSAMCTSILALLLDLSNEASLLKLLNKQTESCLKEVSSLFIQTLDLYQKADSFKQPCDELDLYDITATACLRLIESYPSIRGAIKFSSWIQKLFKNQPSVEAILKATANTSLQDLLIAVMYDTKK